MLINVPRKMISRSSFTARVGGTMLRKRRKGVVVTSRVCALSYSTISAGGEASIGKREQTCVSEAASSADQWFCVAGCCSEILQGRPRSGRRGVGKNVGWFNFHPVAKTTASLSRVPSFDSVILHSDMDVMDARWIWMSSSTAMRSMKIPFSWTTDSPLWLQKRLANN